MAVKLAIYPFKLESVRKCYVDIDFENPYNLSIQDVDFTAEPKVGDLHNWINGTEVQYYVTTKFEEVPMCIGDEYGFGFRPRSVTDCREVPCLKAVVCVDGMINVVEHYRTKVVE